MKFTNDTTTGFPSKAELLSMNEVQKTNTNKVEGKPIVTDEPVTLKVSGGAVSKGGSTIKSQTMTETGEQIVIEKAVASIIIHFIFSMVGISTFMSSFYSIFNGEFGAGFMALLVGGGFSYIGISELLNNKKFTIDKLKKIYYRGQKYDVLGSLDRKQQGYVKDIYAIQLFKKRVWSETSEGGSFTYISYELNLVFKDGERINIMDHAKGEYVDDSAETLGQFLNIPVWKHIANSV